MLVPRRSNWALSGLLKSLQGSDPATVAQYELSDFAGWRARCDNIQALSHQRVSAKVILGQLKAYHACRVGQSIRFNQHDLRASAARFVHGGKTRHPYGFRHDQESVSGRLCVPAVRSCGSASRLSAV